jgi:phosphate transport system substrate-binding protein
MNDTKGWLRIGFVVSALGLVSAAAMVFGSATCALADTVTLHGSVTVINDIIAPHRAGVEKSTGHSLELAGNGSGKGLVDLINGKADASMCSETLDVAVDSVNEGAGAGAKKIDLKSLQFHEVKKTEIVFIVHPSNPVAKLSWEQLRDIFTGKVTNWKQVGGKDSPIAAYTDLLGGGTRAMVKKLVLNGTDFGTNVKTFPSLPRVVEVLSGDENAIAPVGLVFATAKTKTIQTKRVERPLGFITVGAPSPKVKQVIDAFKAASK